MKKIILYAFVLASVLPFGCSKKDDPAPSRTVLLTSKTWKLKSVTLNGQDFTSSYYDEDCQKDDLFNFKTDGKYTYTDAGVKCSPVGDDSGTWSFGANEATLIMDGETQNIDELSSSTIKVSTSDNSTGIPFKYVVTYSAQ